MGKICKENMIDIRHSIADLAREHRGPQGHIIGRRSGQDGGKEERMVQGYAWRCLDKERDV